MVTRYSMVKVLSVITASLFIFFYCGPKQPIPENKPPVAYMPQIGTCPGAHAGPNIPITSADISESSSPYIVWSGDVFSMAFWDLRGKAPQVMVTQIDSNGIKKFLPRPFPSKESAKNQRLSFDGERTAVVFTDENRVMASIVGTQEANVEQVAAYGNDPAAGAFGAVVWVDRGNLFFRCNGMFSPDLSKENGLAPTVIASGGIESPSIVYNGKFYAVVWSSSKKEGREILFQRVSFSGQTMGPPTRVSATAGISRKPVVVWSGSDFAVAWTNAAPNSPKNNFEVFFAVIPELGNVPKFSRSLDFLGSADQVSLVATGKEFGLSWVGNRVSRGSAIYFHRISRNGKLKGETIEVSDGTPFTCGRPSIAWDGFGYGVSWHDDRSNTGSEIFFSYITCGNEEEAEDTETEAGPPKPVLKDIFGEEPH